MRSGCSLVYCKGIEKKPILTTEILNMGKLVLEVTFKDLHKTISMSNSQRQQPTTLFSSVFKELGTNKERWQVSVLRTVSFCYIR
jgi:hypothetical protein